MDFTGFSLSSVHPEDRLVILCPVVGGFGQVDGLPEAEAFELAANLVGIPNGIPNGFERAHFAATAGALERYS